MDGELDRNGRSSGKVFPLLLVRWSNNNLLPSSMSLALQYPYVIAFETTFVEVHHVETGHLVQIIPGTGISCLFADTPPSRVNAPILPPNRQLMYPPGPSGTAPFRPAYNQHPSYSPYNQPYPPAGHPGPSGMMRPPPMPYGMPAPPPPMPNRFARPQVIFTSDDGHVQFLKFPPPTAVPSRAPPMQIANRVSH